MITLITKYTMHSKSDAYMYYTRCIDVICKNHLKSWTWMSRDIKQFINNHEALTKFEKVCIVIVIIQMNYFGQRFFLIHSLCYTSVSYVAFCTQTVMQNIQSLNNFEYMNGNNRILNAILENPVNHNLLHTLWPFVLLQPFLLALL